MRDIRGIILIVIDALRKDAFDNLLETGLLKTMRRLTEKSIVFSNAYALVNATDPSLTTILTGKHPLTHGIIHHGSEITEEERRRAEKLVFLSEYFARKRWFTAAVDFLGRWHKKGFLKYSREEPQLFIGLKHLLMSLVNDKLHTYSRDILRKRSRSPFANPYFNANIVSKKTIEYINYALKSSKKFFILVHYWSTHTPYFANRENTKRIKELLNNRITVNVKDKPLKEILESLGNKEWQQYLSTWFNIMRYNSVYDVIASYYAAIKYVDESLDKIIEFLNEKGILDKTLIIITGDHGESLGEHGIYFDHHGLYQVSLRVPLLFYFESLGRDIRKDTVIHIDITPTIIDLLGERYPDTMDGISLIKYDNKERAVVSIETHTQEKIAVVHNGYKLIESISRKKAVCRYCGVIHGGLRELYDLRRDPLEENNIYGDETDIVKNLHAVLSKPKLKFKALLLRYNKR